MRVSAPSTTKSLPAMPRTVPVGCVKTVGYKTETTTGGVRKQGGLKRGSAVWAAQSARTIIANLRLRLSHCRKGGITHHHC